MALVPLPRTRILRPGILGSPRSAAERASRSGRRPGRNGSGAPRAEGSCARAYSHGPADTVERILRPGILGSPGGAAERASRSGRRPGRSGSGAPRAEGSCARACSHGPADSVALGAFLRSLISSASFRATAFPSSGAGDRFCSLGPPPLPGDGKREERFDEMLPFLQNVRHRNFRLFCSAGSGGMGGDEGQEERGGAESADSIKLYSYWRSSCSWRVRITLAYKGISYQYIPVDIMKGESYSEAYGKLNPNHLVPTLVDGDLVISESSAIVEYLEEKCPTPALLPSNIQKRAVIRQVASWITSGIQPLQNISVLDMVEMKLGPEERLQWAQHFIEKGFSALEEQLTTTAGKYCFGDDFTLADAVLLPQINNAFRYKVDMEKFPTLKKIAEALKELPWIQKTLPEQQPDAC